MFLKKTASVLAEWFFYSNHLIFIILDISSTNDACAVKHGIFISYRIIKRKIIIMIKKMKMILIIIIYIWKRMVGEIKIKEKEKKREGGKIRKRRKKNELFVSCLHWIWLTHFSSHPSCCVIIFLFTQDITDNTLKHLRDFCLQGGK